jgi:hypothetical protein
MPSDLLLLEDAHSKQIKKYFGSLAVLGQFRLCACILGRN